MLHLLMEKLSIYNWNWFPDIFVPDCVVGPMDSSSPICFLIVLPIFILIVGVSIDSIGFYSCFLSFYLDSFGIDLKIYI